MAKRKKRSRASYNKEWYERYRTALKYYNIDAKVLTKPTKISVLRLKRQWKGLNKQMKRKGYVDLPSVYEASKYIKELEARPAQTAIPQKQLANEPMTYEQYEQKAMDAIDELKDAVKRMGSNAGQYFRGKHLDRIAEYKNQAIHLLDYARSKTDPVELAKELARNDFIGRALEYEILDSESGNIGEFYDFVTNELYDMINSAITSSLENI